MKTSRARYLMKWSGEPPPDAILYRWQADHLILWEKSKPHQRIDLHVSEVWGLREALRVTGPGSER